MIRTAGGRRGTRPATRAAALLGLALALILGALPAGAVSSWQDAPEAADAPVVGLGDPGTVAFAFVGRVERRARSLTVYGFVTEIAGLAPEDLFADPAMPSAETARFSVVGVGDPLPRLAVDGVEVATAVGELEIHYNPRAGASFEAPESFFGGTTIATGTARFRDVLLGDPGSTRTVDVFAEIELTESAPVALESGDEVRIGEPEARLHLLGAGLEPAADEGASRTVTTFAARALVVAAPGEAPPATEEVEPAATSRQPPRRPTPEDGDGDGSTLAADVDCEAVEPWLVGTLGRVARTRALVTPVVAVLAYVEADPFAELDPGGLRDAADDLNGLADAQQAAEGPPEVEDADGLLFSAFRSFARGLNLLATAVANEDEDVLAQARALLDDADEALDRGSQPLAGLARACGVPR